MNLAQIRSAFVVFYFFNVFAAFPVTIKVLSYHILSYKQQSHRQRQNITFRSSLHTVIYF